MVTIKNVALFGAALLANGVLANIKFPQPIIPCSRGCPSGKICGGEGICVVPPHHSPRDVFPLLRRQISTNGQCGTQNGGTICPTGGVGTCCSQYGWCGSTPDHCGTGCQSGCGGTDPPIDPPPPTGTQTTDGSCGSTNGGTICGTWPLGSCCSQYGWCGASEAHCGAGCQSGPCLGGGTPGGGTAPGPSPAPLNPVLGNFAQLTADSGVPAMHAALMPNGRVMFLDKVEDYTQLTLPNGRYAYSSEYNPVSGNTPVPLAYSTNAFCSGGTFLANGDLIAIGGNDGLPWLDPTVGNGFDGIRYLTRRSSSPSSTGFDWREPGNKLNSPRWYPSAQTLADGRVFVVSGSRNGLDPTQLANNNPTYEFLNAAGVSITGSTNLPILVANQPYYMYPFLHLLRDGRMFIFTSKSSQILNMANPAVGAVNLPNLPGLYRTYPNTGGSVMFPLSSADGWATKVMICGGGSYQDITSPTDPSCGVISPEATTPTWEMDSMPEGRGMVEGVLLPDGKVLWLNGANRGAQGFNLAEQPTTTALLYDPVKPLGQRFTRLATSAIPRLYHSVALLLLDGTVLVTGSGPNEMPVLTDTPFRTDFRMERYTPPYFIGANNSRRPTNVNISNKSLGPATAFTITFTAPTGATDVKIVLYHGGFVTHSVHMGHRMVYCDRTGWVPGATSQTVVATTPPNKNITPPGPYVLYVVIDGVPSAGQFVMIV